MTTITQAPNKPREFAAFEQASFTHFDQLPDSAHVSIDTVCALFGCSSATIWRRVRAGQLVSPVRLGLRTTRWRVGDLRVALSGKA